MKRKDFLKASLLATAGLAIKGSEAASVMSNNNDELLPVNPVGFNHLPNTSSKLAPNTVLHKAETRGGADYGWLKTKHTFSFANYYNPDRMNFGVLRVLNDDIITGGSGFPTHPHDNMEIISIPLFGDLQHKDSMGNTSVIRAFDVQSMTAGKGINIVNTTSIKIKRQGFYRFGCSLKKQTLNLLTTKKLSNLWIEKTNFKQLCRLMVKMVESVFNSKHGLV